MVRSCLDSVVVLSANDPLLAIFPKLWGVVEGFAVQDLLPTWACSQFDLKNSLIVDKDGLYTCRN